MWSSREPGNFRTTHPLPLRDTFYNLPKLPWLGHFCLLFMLGRERWPLAHAPPVWRCTYLVREVTRFCLFCQSEATKVKKALYGMEQRRVFCSSICWPYRYSIGLKEPPNWATSLKNTLVLSLDWTLEHISPEKEKKTQLPFVDF